MNIIGLWKSWRIKKLVEKVSSATFHRMSLDCFFWNVNTVLPYTIHISYCKNDLKCSSLVQFLSESVFEKLEFNDFKDNIFKDDAVQSTSATLKLLRISSLQKKWSLPFRVSSVNVTKSTENWLIYCISLTLFWTLIQGQKNSIFKNYFQIRFKYKSWWSINLDLDPNEKSEKREKILPHYCFFGSHS